MTRPVREGAERATLDGLIGRYPALSPIRGEIERGFRLLAETYDRGGKLLLCGNGGSCADADHMAGELNKGFLKRRPLSPDVAAALSALGEEGAGLSGRLQSGLPAIPLQLPATQTAAQNDLGGDAAFAQQVIALGARGDALVGISASGNAANVRLAALAARAAGLRVLALTGAGGGLLAGRADVAIRVPETEVYRIQELHLPVYHALCAMLEERYFEA